MESPSEIEKITQALNKIAQENTCDDGSIFLFAVGDGNHSLATAKAVWDERKAELVKNNAADEQIATDNARFALVEIVNIYDSGLTFEPIHRVIFNIDNDALIEFLQKKLGGTIKEVQNEKELEENITLAFTFSRNKKIKVGQPVEGKPTFLVMYVILCFFYFISGSRFHYSLLLPPKMRSK